MLPDGWTERPLATVAEIRTGLSKSGKRIFANPVEMPYLRVANVQDGHLDLAEVKEITVEKSDIERYALHDGDVLLTEGGDFDKLGRGTVWRSQIPHCLHQNHVFAVRVDRSILLPEFLSALTGSAYGKAYFVMCSKQSTNLASINSSQLKAFPVVLPSVSEQSAIIDALAVWDRTIDLITKLILANRERRRGLVQEAMLGRRRIAEFHEPWQAIKISDCLTESRVPGSDGRTARKITVKLYGRGVVPKEERIAGSQATKYYRRSAGQFIYSKLDFLNGAFGLIPPEMDGYESTLDLPCFDFNRDVVVPEFFLYFVSRESFYSRFAGAAVGGRKARRIQVEEFLAAPIKVPEIAEQRRIADFLAVYDWELSLLEQKRALLKQQKQGLMQQLLTGKVRVPA